jgi:hypothetical protein
MGSEAVQTSAVGLASSNRMIVSRSVLGPFPFTCYSLFGFARLPAKPHAPSNSGIAVAGVALCIPRIEPFQPPQT